MTAKGFWKASSKLGRGRERGGGGGRWQLLLPNHMKNCLLVDSAAIHQVKKTAKTFGNQKLFLTATRDLRSSPISCMTGSNPKAIEYWREPVFVKLKLVASVQRRWAQHIHQNRLQCIRAIRTVRSEIWHLMNQKHNFGFMLTWTSPIIFQRYRIHRKCSVNVTLPKPSQVLWMVVHHPRSFMTLRSRIYCLFSPPLLTVSTV